MTVPVLVPRHDKLCNVDPNLAGVNMTDFIACDCPTRIQPKEEQVSERLIEFCIDNGAGEILRYRFATSNTDADTLISLREALEMWELSATSLADALVEVADDALLQHGLRRVTPTVYHEIVLPSNTLADFLEGEDVSDLRAQLLAMSQGLKK